MGLDTHSVTAPGGAERDRPDHVRLRHARERDLGRCWFCAKRVLGSDFLIGDTLGNRIYNNSCVLSAEGLDISTTTLAELLSEGARICALCLEALWRQTAELEPQYVREREQEGDWLLAEENDEVTEFSAYHERELWCGCWFLSFPARGARDVFVSKSLGELFAAGLRFQFSFPVEMVRFQYWLDHDEGCTKEVASGDVGDFGRHLHSILRFDSGTLDDIAVRRVAALRATIQDVSIAKMHRSSEKGGRGHSSEAT